MKICHIITDLNTGGAEMMLYKLISKMDREKFKNFVISMTDIGPIGRNIQDIGIPVYSLGMKIGFPDPRGFWRLVRLVKEKKPAIIQSWMYHANLAVILILPFLSKTQVVWGIRHTIYDLAYEKQLTALIIKISAKLSNIPARVIYNSKVSAEKHIDLGYEKKNAVIIPNGFNIKHYSPDEKARYDVRLELGIGYESLLIGRVARYHPMKDYITLLEAASLIVSRYPDAHFLLLGDGVTSDNTELYQQVQKKCLEKNVHLLGRREDVARLTAALDIAVSSSYFGEAFPNVIGEAMACGVPCVVTDVGDSSYIVGDCGLVVPPKNPEAITNALMALIEKGYNVRQDLGKKARQRIVENFEIGKVVENYEILYNNLIKCFI